MISSALSQRWSSQAIEKHALDYSQVFLAVSARSPTQARIIVKDIFASCRVKFPVDSSVAA